MLSQKYKYMIAVGTVLLLSGLSFSDQAAATPSKIDWDKKLATGYRDLDFGNYDKALHFFQSEINHHPESGAARTGMGLTLKKKGKPAEAVAAFRRATEVEPDYAESHYELGALLENDKNYSEACKCFERYLQLAPLSSKRASVEDRIRNCKENM